MAIERGSLHRRIPASSPRPSWTPLLDEGPLPFLGIGALVEHTAQVVGNERTIGTTNIHGAVDRSLVRLDRKGRIFSDRTRQKASLFHQAIGRHHAVDEADLVRPLGTDRL